MASHHHHHLHHPGGGCHTSSANTSAVCYCCTSYNYITPCHNPPPPPDPHFLCHHHLPTQSQLCSPYSHPPHPTQSFHQQPTQYHSSPSDLHFQRAGYFGELLRHQQGGLSHAHAHSQPTVSSLLRRIAALESSLHHHSSSPSQSLRDAAARTIQTHFRAFLVRRSRTLRQLKDLASIKSTINILKSSVSDNNHLDPLVLSHEALHLLLKLDSIQGDDPMIRDGKKSISRELTRLFDLIDGVTVKRPELSCEFIRKNARQGENSKKSRDLYSNQKKGNVGSRGLGNDKGLEDLVSRIEALYNKVHEKYGEGASTRKNGVPQGSNGGFRKRPDGIQAKVKKNVKFSEDGKVYYVPRRNEQVLVEDCDSDDEEKLQKMLEGLRREAEEVGGISFKNTEEDDEEAQSDDRGSNKSSEDEGERGPTFSAPLPVRMETRSDSMDKRKTVKLAE